MSELMKTSINTLLFVNSFMCISVFFLINHEKKYLSGAKKDKLYIFNRWIANISETLIILTFILYAYHFEEFRKFLLFETPFLIFFLIFFTQVHALKRDKKKGIAPYGFKIFNNSNENINLLDTLFIILCCIGIIFSFLSSYALYVYPKMNYNFGGGYPVEKTLYLKNDTITGNIIHSNESYFYLKCDSTIRQIKLDEIVQYSE